MGDPEGFEIGFIVGSNDGDAFGLAVGDAVGFELGRPDGDIVGPGVGRGVFTVKVMFSPRPIQSLELEKPLVRSSSQRSSGNASSLRDVPIDPMLSSLRADAKSS